MNLLMPLSFLGLQQPENLLPPRQDIWRIVSFTAINESATPNGMLSARLSTTWLITGRSCVASREARLTRFVSATVGTFKWWADLVGDDSWLWDTIFSFYKKSPQFTAPNFEKIGPGFDLPYDSNAFSPQGGPLQVSFANYQQPVSPFLAKGMRAVGIKEQDGLNSGLLNGYAATTVCVDPKSETRSSSEASFLQTAIKRSVLQVYQGTMAKKIIFNSAKKATGVLINTNGETYVLSSRKEIIISSGAVSESRGHLINFYLYLCLVSLPSITHGLRHWACCNVGSK